jgi:DNA gyrase/topoisomerase IV subunit B
MSAASERWEVGAVLTRTLFDDEDDASDEKHVSFINGINTKKGGKHVDCLQARPRYTLQTTKKKRKIDIKPAQLKDSLMPFVNATIVNPAFGSSDQGNPHHSCFEVWKHLQDFGQRLWRALLSLVCPR